jgi:hypothetical protein
MGFLTQKDSTLYRGFFKEMAYLRGIPVKYQYVNYTDPTIYAEMISSYSEEIDMDIIFDANPKTATLKAINWVPNFPDDKPYIAYLPWDAPNLTVKAIISIPPIDSLREKPKKFEVTTINTLLEFPDAWVCTLAPLFNTKTPMPDYTVTNNNYTDPSVALDRNNKDKPSLNYSYLNVDE